MVPVYCVVLTRLHKPESFSDSAIYIIKGGRGAVSCVVCRVPVSGRKQNQYLLCRLVHIGSVNVVNILFYLAGYPLKPLARCNVDIYCSNRNVVNRNVV